MATKHKRKSAPKSPPKVIRKRRKVATAKPNSQAPTQMTSTPTMPAGFQPPPSFQQDH